MRQNAVDRALNDQLRRAQTDADALIGEHFHDLRAAELEALKRSDAAPKGRAANHWSAVAGVLGEMIRVEEARQS